VEFLIFILPLLQEAIQIHNDEDKKSELIAKNGKSLISSPSTVLTHCNTGALAAGGFGTALSIVKSLYESGMIKHVFVDETRPLLQGSG